MAISISFLQRLPLAKEKPWAALGFTLVLVGIGYLARVAAMPLLPEGFPYATFLPVVIVTTFLFGLKCGIVAAILCGATAWYSLVPPLLTFEPSAAKVTTFAVFILLSSLNVALIHWMQRANAGLAAERETSRALAENRELLFQELQHRISNNLQMVAALLALQKQKVGDASARSALDEAARRLSLIGRISRKLYDPTGTALGVKTFLTTLYQDVVRANSDVRVDGSVTVDEDIVLSSESAIPLALIFTESLANSIEHGFAGRSSGTIDVYLSRRPDDMLELMIADDGCGLPAGFDLSRVDSLGLRIANTLAQNLNGTYTLEKGAGTTARLVIPA
jgi:two-component sensor histidine kinase